MGDAFTLRLATASDVPALDALIPLSVRALQAAVYSPAQIAAALGPVFGVDHQLIRDGTYFVAEGGGAVVGCGGWSRRRAEFGGTAARADAGTVLDPGRDAARLRAFFVHPAWVRRGIGRSVVCASEAATRAAGFGRAVLVAAPAGEPLYAAVGYAAAERYEVELPGGLGLPVVRMVKSLGPEGQRAEPRAAPDPAA